MSDLKIYELTPRAGSSFRWTAKGILRRVIVLAASAKEAREKVSFYATARYAYGSVTMAKMYASPKHTVCRQLKLSGKARVVCADYDETELSGF